MTTSPNGLSYSAIDGWRQMVHHGHDLLGAALELATDLPARNNHLLVYTCSTRTCCASRRPATWTASKSSSASRTWASAGYQAADGLRANQLIDTGLSAPILATISMADNDQSERRLLSAPEALVAAAPGLPEPSWVDLPDPSGLRLDSVDLPSDAFFARPRLCHRRCRSADRGQSRSLGNPQFAGPNCTPSSGRRRWRVLVGSVAAAGQ